VVWDLVEGKELKILKGHSGLVRAIDITPDGKMAVSGADDHTCILWNLESGEVINIMKDHTNWVRAVCISPNGKKAISGSADNTCILWDLDDSTTTISMKDHNNSVEKVLITPDGKRAISGSSDNTLTLWDIENNIKLAKYPTFTDVKAFDLIPEGIFGGNAGGEFFTLNAHKDLLCPGPGIVTACQVWDHELNQLMPLTADCPFCGNRFAPSKSTLDTIEKITNNADISLGHSPCFNLIEGTWQEKGLQSNCTKCGKKLKFNPFFVGSR